MFEDSLLESAHRFKTRRGATTALSVALQSIVLGALVLLPLIYTEALPRMQMLTTVPASPPPPAAPPRTPAPRHEHVVTSELHDDQVLIPTHIPAHAATLADPVAPSTTMIGDPNGVEHSIGAFDHSNPLNSVLTAHVPVPPEPRTERLVVTGGVTEGHLIRRVAPEYPPVARANRIEGDVLLHAIIARDGSIENLSVVSGHPFLVRAALDAVRQWRYQPFLLSGRPVEVDTEILVRFRFD